MGFRSLEQIEAYRAVRSFKLEVYRLARMSPALDNDRRFRDQLFNAAASAEVNIAEGFRRYSTGDFIRFLRISRASLEEAAAWLQDGIDREYFRAKECQVAFELANSAGRLTTGLIKSLQAFTKRLPRHEPPPAPKEPEPPNPRENLGPGTDKGTRHPPPGTNKRTRHPASGTRNQ